MPTDARLVVVGSCGSLIGPAVCGGRRAFIAAPLLLLFPRMGEDFRVQMRRGLPAQTVPARLPPPSRGLPPRDGRCPEDQQAQEPVGSE